MRITLARPRLLEENKKTAEHKLNGPFLRIWRRRQDSNLWYPFEVQRFSKPPLSATQPRLQPWRKARFNSSPQANFVKVEGILRPKTWCHLSLDTPCFYTQNSRVVTTSIDEPVGEP